MRLWLLIPLFLIFLIPQAFAYNSLENTELHAESAVISLDIEFGEDTVKSGFMRDYVTNHVDDITLTFYGDEITLSEPKVKITKTGNHFRISSIPEGIIMYGHKNMDLENYKINIYLATDKGLVKFPVSTSAPIDDEKVVETEPIEEKERYIPDLKMASSHDFRTYWKETFNIDVQTYDGRINPSATGFEGRIDGVDVKVLLSLDSISVATLSGVTEYGEWKGEYFFAENISTPGEYIVDVIVSYLGETVSKSSSMFIIGTTTSSDSSNHAPIANAGVDQNQSGLTKITLDGSGSSDPDSDTITFSWVQTSGAVQTLSDTTAIQPTFTPTGTDTFVFQLTVSDGRNSSTDTVTITVS